MSNELVSVIIPTYNRFSFLLNAIHSVIKQTYKNTEIIIINDCSTQDEYYNYNFNKEFGDKVFIVNLPRNSRSYLGRVAGGGNSRNIGIMLAKGEYIAFLDDDDYFLPTKIAKQLDAMKKTNCFMSCTEGYRGMGVYDENKSYQNWHYKGYYWNALQNKFKHNKELLDNMYKNDINIWGKDCIYTHNCTIGGSSVMIHKSLINKAGYFPLSHYGEDWLYWKKLINYSNCVFIREPLTYIDVNHGDGREYTDVKKIAFCFLIYDKIEHEELWYNFFKNIDKNKYSIYIHSKKNTTLKYFNEYIVDNLIDTRYCTPSIINAHNILFKKACNDNNYKIISLSGACIPVKSFDHIYDFCTKNDKCIFNVCQRGDILPRWRGVSSLKQFYKQEHIQKAANWFILNNSVAKILTNEESTEIQKKYRGCACPEEHYFLTTIYDKGLESNVTEIPNLQDGGVTMTNWNEPNYKYGRGYATKNYKGRWPKYYETIEKEEIDYLFTRPCLFARKFKEDCLVLPDNILLCNYVTNKLITISK